MQDHASAPAMNLVRKPDAWRTARDHAPWELKAHPRVQPTAPRLAADPLAAVRVPAPSTPRPAAANSYSLRAE